MSTPPSSPEKQQTADSPEYEAPEGEESSAEELEVSEDEEIEEIEQVEELETSPKRPRIEKANYGPLHFKNDATSGHMPYVPGRWTAQNLYRMPADIVLDTIRQTGTEGIGRYEIGQVLGYDGTTKHGGRRVTAHVVNCQTEHPDHIGQFQQMNGKVRTIRYFWKESEQPERFEKLLQEFEELSGIACPFKIGEVVKFPDLKLNTLRISDVSLKRLNRCLRLVGEQRVIVTINRVIKFIQEHESADGYKFQIDKKSVMKCLLALQNKRLLSVWERTVRSDSVDYQIQIVGHPSIPSVEDPEVFRAIGEILDTYHKEGRVFPHGQLRVQKKKHGEPNKSTEFDGKIADIDENLSAARTINDRFHFFRLQTVKNSWSRKCAENEEPGTASSSSSLLKPPDEDVTPGENLDDDVNKEMIKLFAKNPQVPAPRGTTTTGGAAQQRCTQYYFGRDSLGYQRKAMRLYLIHELAWHFVHGHARPEEASVFEIFPPTEPFRAWPVRDETTARVFCNDGGSADSQYRYVPAQPQYAGVARGWFMVQDLLAAMPLSVFVLTNYVPKTIEREVLMPYLLDPLKRHLCIGYLPPEVRQVLLKEKKAVKLLEHTLFVLGAMGLVAMGPNPSARRFPGAASSVFFVAKQSRLYDTSASAKSYSSVSPPIESNAYQKYEYSFEARADVGQYWHHLRAIVQSTPLSYRIDDANGQRADLRHKGFSMGLFDKKLVEHDYSEHLEHIETRCQTDGVAGFDSALFLHLKRHWDLATNPHAVVSWFVVKFRRAAESMRREIEKRVKVLQKDWNSFVRLNLSEDVRAPNVIRLEYPQKTGKVVKGEKKLPAAPKAAKKRKLDSVDLVSHSRRINVRCRFTPKERDQLILIRAVGFFLNPVYRFWLDPTVLRDLMHEFVPESRNKTVQSLMACGVRELVRSNRLAYLQRVVRNLSTFPEMRRLRSELCSTPVTPSSSKTEFFKDAFRTAMRLLFVDNDRIPPVGMSDANFKLFLASGNVSVTKETSVANSQPYRSQRPHNVGHIQHCVTANVLLSVLIHSKDGAFAEPILDQMPPAVLQTVLHALKTDGLVSRSRSLDALTEIAIKNYATLSYYFRHFFAHRFHSDLVEGSGRLMEEIDDPSTADSVELCGDLPEVVVAAASTFYGDKYALEMQVDADVLDAFSLTEKEQTNKKIRYLESANLHFEKVHVSLEKVGDIARIDASLVDVERILDRSRPIAEKIPLDEWSQQFEAPLRRLFRTLCHHIKSAKVGGVSVPELERLARRVPRERLPDLLDTLREHQQIVECGVDEQRWVSIEYEPVWWVTIGGRKWLPRPWVSPEGQISLPTVRWLAESVLLQIVAKLGIQLSDLLFYYEFAVQPIAIREIVQLLEQLHCIEIVDKIFMSPKLASPFAEPESTQIVTYVHPTVDGVERFSRIFHEVDLLTSMTSSRPNY